jgi:hypothetical protein
LATTSRFETINPVRKSENSQTSHRLEPHARAAYHACSMEFPERPELPLTNMRKALVVVGSGLFLVQVGLAFALAPSLTGTGDANALALLGLWCACVAWSTVTVLLLVRQADVPDVATASMLVTIPPFAAFAFMAAYDARGTDAEYNLVSAIFFGVTAGALTAMLVWGAAMALARLLRLPTSASLGHE